MSGSNPGTLGADLSPSVVTPAGSSTPATMPAVAAAALGAVQSGQSVTLGAGGAQIGSVAVSNGSAGSDASSSANRGALPAAVGTSIGTSTYGGSGPFASYQLIASVPASSTRVNIDIENVSGQTIIVTRDDGTASPGSAPANASWFPLAGGSGAPSQGGSWSSQTFRGRIQIWAASVPTYPPTVMVD